MNTHEKFNSKSNEECKPGKYDQDIVIPSIAKMRVYFEKISKEEFLHQMNACMKSDNDEDLHAFFYYIMLFADLENIWNFLDDDTVPIEFFEKLIIFILGYCAKYNYSPILKIDFVLLFLSEENLLRIIQNSKFIQSDKLLMLHILTRLDRNSLDTFFQDRKNLLETLSSYYRLPEEVMESVVVRNRKFYNYIMMKLLAEKNLDSKTQLFIKKFEKKIKEFKCIRNTIMNYLSEVDLLRESKLPFNKRDMKRISFLVNTIRMKQDFQKSIDYFYQGGVFADDQERQIVSALVVDPLLKSVFPSANEENEINHIVNCFNPKVAFFNNGSAPKSLH